MSLIAINILLDPDAATVEKAKAVNARLREDYPDGFALDANHAPHITILQRFVRSADLEAVASAVAEVLLTEQPIKWECNATGYYDLAYENLGLVGISPVKKTKEVIETREVTQATYCRAETDRTLYNALPSCAPTAPSRS